MILFLFGMLEMAIIAFSILLWTKNDKFVWVVFAAISGFCLYNLALWLSR